MSPATRVSDAATLSRILHAAVGAAHAGAGVIRDGAARRSSLVWESKGPADFVSEVDRTSEERIIEALHHALRGEFPALRVLAEESWEDTPLTDELTFIVDPLDGTTNFLHAVPVYAVSIGALLGGELVAGVVLNAATGELFTATRGGGACADGAPISVSRITDPSRALIGTGIPFGGNASVARYAAQMQPVAAATAGLRRAGSAAIDLAWVAAGRYDAFWELHLAPYDIAAGILLIREAGGIVTGMNGEAADIRSSPLVAGNTAMHGWLLGTLQQTDARLSDAPQHAAPR